MELTSEIENLVCRDREQREKVITWIADVSKDVIAIAWKIDGDEKIDEITDDRI